MSLPKRMPYIHSYAITSMQYHCDPLYCCFPYCFVPLTTHHSTVYDPPRGFTEISWEDKVSHFSPLKTQPTQTVTCLLFPSSSVRPHVHTALALSHEGV